MRLALRPQMEPLDDHAWREILTALEDLLKFSRARTFDEIEGESEAADRL